MADLKKGPRGLPAISRAREERSRRGPRWTMRAGLTAAGAVVIGLLMHTIVSSRELDSDKQALLAKQRALQATLGVRWFPLRDRLEEDVLGAARAYAGDLVEPEARGGTFRTQPGLYLRMRVADAMTVTDIRRVAADAKKDAFASCLLREPNDPGLRGELDGGAFAEQPWNLGRAYAATKILSDAWVRAVKDADGDMRMRVFSEQYDTAIRDEIPVAVDVVTRAQFFLLVLDEEVVDAEQTEAGLMTEEALQLLQHPARVEVFDLRTNKELLRLRRSGSSLVISTGERPVTDPETRDAMQRQANNCALAGLVESAMGPRGRDRGVP
jgi:hypothetical protein